MTSTGQTDALRRLMKWMSRDPKRTQAWLARQLGVSAPSVHAWMKGQTRPEPHLRKALRELASIPEESWWNDDERKAFAATMKRADAPDPPRPSRTGTDD